MGAIIALDLGRATGWAVHTTDGLITSGTHGFTPCSFECGGMRYPRFRQWLAEASLPLGGFNEEEKTADQ